MRVIDFFDKGASSAPHRPFLVTDDATVTFAEARTRSWEVAAGLHAAGLRAGDTVGVLAPNEETGFLAMLGLWRAGGVWAPLNHLNALAATTDFMNDVGCRWLFLHRSFADRLDAIRDAVPGLERVIALGGEVDGAASLEELVEQGRGTTVPDLGDPFGAVGERCVLWPTGGTTGRSKAVVWTNQVWATLNELTTRHWPTVPEPVNLMVAPVTHAAGVMGALMASVGATVVIRPGFDADDALDHVERHGVTHMFVPPTAFYAMLDAQRRRPRDLSSLAMLLVAAAPVSPDRLGQGVAAFGPCVAQCWGQGEAPFLLTYLSPEEVAAAVAGDRPARLASCGRPTFAVQVAAMDDDQQLLGPGGRGELVVRSRLVTPGYLGLPEATAELHAGGWHHTGDVGELDEDGYVYIVDRKKDMVITGGFNVFPAEVEAAILALPEVAECAVIGVPDDKWGEAVLAVVVPRDPDWADADAVIAHAKAALGSVKAPKRVQFTDALARTPVGKTDKKALRAEHWTGLARAVN
ncbi:AMP-binding protein [Conexibacter sp. SYSU D00693]|uniref:AMP-binding protein n=1 Tax=Conexibacter sp. SYSU D00693 TaxID=2812560 RepID=UPI00196AF667|nr:AMP-binding protein [Conexibacter sp. SYSU D00693]